MIVMLDTNIVLDVLEHRDLFFESAYKILQMSTQERIECIVSASSITDIYYIIKRNVKDSSKAKDAIVRLSSLIRICDTTSNDISTALSYDMEDFEDAVLSAVAKRERVEYIISRNAKDFVNSPVQVILPDDFLNMMKV